MEPEINYFNMRKEKAREIYSAQNEIYNPYFKTKIILNSDGFHHLQFSARVERNKKEQLLKFSLLPLGLDVIRKSGTIQEYRKLLTPIGKPSPLNNSIPMKEVEYWGFAAITGKSNIKIRVIVRRVGDGNIIFWSVMPNSKIKHGYQKIFDVGIEDS
ncbi:MAG: hypothetical protein WCS89_02525 [Candidatus Paceibacterota bacterium]